MVFSFMQIVNPGVSCNVLRSDYKELKKEGYIPSLGLLNTKKKTTYF
jgi:hypothetical protein